LLERRERFIKEKPTREYLSDEFGIDSFNPNMNKGTANNIWGKGFLDCGKCA
jgi:hypothetical protein